ncbi:MAG: GNAT family N-acetyltransferase [Saprospiraceae bacterium]|nr:GNAT family N-acetyltransferase [Lewinella sp.]
MTQDAINLFRLHYRQWPPYLSFSDEQITQVLIQYQKTWDRHYPEQPHLRAAVLGNNSITYRAGLYYDEERGHIAWLVMDPSADTGEVVFTLLAESSSYGITQPAFGIIRDPFGLGWSGLSKQQLAPVIHHLQHQHDYCIDQAWMVMEYRFLQAAAVNGLLEEMSDWEIEYSDDTAAGEWNILLSSATEPAGECSAWSIPEYLESMPPDKWMTIEWIGLEPAFRGRRLGLHLLLQQLNRQQQRGVEHIVLWTETKNHHARNFFRQHGFREVGEVVGLQVR